jgi:omega-hydroxy-beta-dihydromenaquinone-9 sulfotransferase
MPAKLKHRWSLGHNYLAGITAGAWWRLLRENGFAVDPAYWHRGLFVTALSLLNSWYRRKEERLWGETVERTSLAGPPLFVLGHWRSGTTHLHNLLALDEQLAFTNTYQVVNPHTFLTTEAFNTRRFRALLPDTRPMDNVALSFDAPQEDEFGPALACFRSLYPGISFPRNVAHYERYLTFRGVPPEEVEEWKAAFLWFLRKLTVKHGRPLVLKSPPHTARVRLLLEMFPDARFLHIHRDPYVVFQSFQHYYDTAGWYTYLQRPDLDGLDDLILQRYAVMYGAYFEERSLIPPGRLHEIAFADLEADPVGQVATAYEALDLSGFGRLEPRLRAYVESLGSYKKNRYQEIPADVRSRVAQAWGRSFEEWGYPVEPVER